MLGVFENRITGFYFVPGFKANREGIISKLEVELLEDGNVISTKIFENISEEEFERLQQQLLDMSIINCGLEKNWTMSKELSRRNKVLGVVNMFKIDIIEKHENQLKDINITFIRSGNFAYTTKFEKVSDSNLAEIVSILSDNIGYNLACDTQCNAVTPLDLIPVIEQKIY